MGPLVNSCRVLRAQTAGPITAIQTIGLQSALNQHVLEVR